MIKDIKLAVITVTFLLILIPFGIYNTLKPDKVYSDLENRRLIKKPFITLSGVWNGKYFNDFEEYVKDQFAFKDGITSSYVNFNFYALNRSKVNGYYLCKDGRLYEDKNINVEERVKYVKEKNEYIKKVAKEVTSMGKEFYTVYAPWSSDFSSDGLPLYAKTNMKKVLKVEEEINSISNDVNYINMRDIFNKEKGTKEEVANEFYFKTDHHWNINGAYKAYEYIVNESRKKFPSMEPPLRENEEFMVDKYYRFNGSYNRQLQFNIDTDEELKIYRPRKDLLKERITNYEEGEDPIAKDLIESNYSYSVFMGGDIARDVLKTYRAELPNVLIVGDSFTNALETILYTSFNQMHSIDLRDNNRNEIDIAHYANRQNIDIVVFVESGI